MRQRSETYAEKIRDRLNPQPSNKLRRILQKANIVEIVVGNPWALQVWAAFKVWAAVKPTFASKNIHTSAVEHAHNSADYPGPGVGRQRQQFTARDAGGATGDTGSLIKSARLKQALLA